MPAPQGPMDPDAVVAHVARIVIDALHAQKSANTITADTRLDALGLDSLNIVDVLLQIEETFGIPVEDELIDPEMVETIGSLAAFVQARLPRT